MSASLFDLTGRVALVTGAYRGLGFGISRGLAQAGATVVLNGRKPDELAQAAKVLTDAGFKADVAAFDVNDRAGIRGAVAAIIAKHGGIDILVNNAGIQRRGPMVDFAEKDWDDVIATNLTAPFVVSQAVLPGMIANKRGKIIHIASLMSDHARPTVIPYTAAKGGVRQLTRGMAVELAPMGIQVNAIAPGYFETDINREFWDTSAGKRLIERIPQRRLGQPRDLDGALLLLASDAGAFMTGSVIVVDGGHTVGSL
jgi:gluconate 5-dehydrogenase